ncbi:MAG: DUF2252 domain-containing protein [Terracidiphilus sp.]|jgi:uncharacterized protein (DUF2252 family)
MQWATPQERRNLGQARRKQVGRQEHNQLNPKARTTPPLELLVRSMRGRLPALVKLKYKLMADSPFGYFRGAVPVMAADLAHLPNAGIVCQLCGDAHVRNLGAFAAPDGRLTFDINDFDETIRGPFEWDLKRMAASLVLAGRGSGHKEASAHDAVEKFVERYAAQIAAFAKMSTLEVAHYQVHRLAAVAPVHAALLKAQRATPQHTLEQLTEPAPAGKDAVKASEPVKHASKKQRKKDAHGPAHEPVTGAPAGQIPPRRFKEVKPILTRVTGSQAAAVLAALGPYRQMLEPQRQHLLSLYRPIDVAFKVVGTGSVGLRDYCIYFEGNGPADPLFLQIKEEPASAYTAYLPDAHPAHQNGQRTAEGQKAMQVQSDPFLGWTHFGGRDYLVRQLNDHKGSIELEDLAGAGLEAYGEVCGELLARGHARSGDPLNLAGYIGSGDGFAEALAKFGSAYADQTEKDWNELKRSAKVSAKP